VEAGIERGFDLFYSAGGAARLRVLRPAPLHDARAAVPIVPLHVNVYLRRSATPRRCYDWGKATRRILRARPERVVLIASGGMSHFPGDRSVRRRPSSSTTAAPRRARGPVTAARWPRSPRGIGQDGQHRAQTWATLLGAVGDAKADVYCYEPSWHQATRSSSGRYDGGAPLIDSHPASA